MSQLCHNSVTVMSQFSHIVSQKGDNVRYLESRAAVLKQERNHLSGDGDAGEVWCWIGFPSRLGLMRYCNEEDDGCVDG